MNQLILEIVAGGIWYKSDAFQPLILVAYFSCTGTTKPLAEYVAEYLNGNFYAIEAWISDGEEKELIISFFISISWFA